MFEFSSDIESHLDSQNIQLQCYFSRQLLHVIEHFLYARHVSSNAHKHRRI
jgi:hypothetical protein